MNKPVLRRKWGPLIALMAMLGISVSAPMASVILEFNPANWGETNYYIVIGSRSGIGDLGHHAIGLSTNVTISGLRVGVTYYFTATASDATQETGPSNEVAYRPLAPTANAAAMLTIVPTPLPVPTRPPKILIFPVNGNMQILIADSIGTWQFVLEKSPNLTSGIWIPLTQGTLSGSSNIATFVDYGTINSAQGFYRVRAVPQ